MAATMEWRKHLEALGFGVGASLEACGNLVTVRDVLGGPLIHQAAGVAVSVRSSGEGLAIALVERNGTRWAIRSEHSEKQPSRIKEALISAAGQYYHAVHEHFSAGKAAGHAA